MPTFAPMTANLLVRKGEAAPSTVTPLFQERDGDENPILDALRPPPVFAPRQIKPAPLPPPAPDQGGKTRRLVLHLSPREYERLGLLAVKRGKTRHGLAQEALAAFFRSMSENYGCACIGDARDGAYRSGKDCCKGEP